MAGQAGAQDSVTVLLNGRLHVGDGTVIENSAVAMHHGKILWVADATTIRLDGTARIIRCSGKDIYPGFIAPNTRLGLNEIELVRATHDMNEVGEFNPDARALIAYNTDSRVIPTVRFNGVLVAQSVPVGGRVTGTSSIFKLDGWNWEDAVLRADDGVHLNWPQMQVRTGWWAEPGTSNENKDYEKQVTAIYDFFEQAQSYCDGKPDRDNLRFEAMRGVFDSTQNLYVHAQYARDILDAIMFAKAFGVKMVLVGGRDSWMITTELRSAGIAVILRRNHTLPANAEDDIDQSYKTPALLHQAGVKFCLSDEDFWQQRNLPFQAGTAVAYGLPYEEAVKAITSSTAEILGIADRVGTVTDGMDATLIVCSGDALDMRTNHVEMAYIDGEPVPLRNHQQENYERYMEKYGLPLEDK
jgi:imidazolonepropionase-like amidohydrolase